MAVWSFGLDSPAMKLLDQLRRLVRPQPSSLVQPPSPPEDPAAVDEREMRRDAENKHVEHLDTGEDDPNRYANP
jgi:hypothetical protein